MGNRRGNFFPLSPKEEFTNSKEIEKYKYINQQWPLFYLCSLTWGITETRGGKLCSHLQFKGKFANIVKEKYKHIENSNSG